MNRKKATALNYGISIIFAAAMLTTSYLLKGSEHAQTATHLLIALWFIPFTLLSRVSAKALAKEEQGE